MLFPGVPVIFCLVKKRMMTPQRVFYEQNRNRWMRMVEGNSITVFRDTQGLRDQRCGCHRRWCRHLREANEQDKVKDVLGGVRVRDSAAIQRTIQHPIQDAILMRESLSFRIVHESALRLWSRNTHLNRNLLVLDSLH